MKMLAAMLLAASIHASATVHAQRIQLKLINSPLSNAFKAISDQTGTLFLYTDELLRDAKPITINIQDADLTTAMNACLEDQPLDWSIVNKTVVIMRRQRKTASNQRDTLINIRGLVSSDGVGLAGVSISVKGSTAGTITNESGAFELSKIAPNAVLLFSSVGYQPLQVAVAGKPVLHVRLLRLINSLDETVVIGYGTTTRRLNTGSVGRISSQEISRQPVSNVLQALQGRIPGLYITQNSGMPGSDFKIQLRGQNSLRSEGNELLFIIDGVPIPSTSLHGNMETANGAVHPLNSISPQDIASIEVLKDADATAIYGSRGANGVVLITTKKGHKGTPLLTVDFFKGVGKTATRIDLLDTKQYLAVRREAFANDAATPDPNFDYDLTQWDSVRSTDWQKELLGGTAHFTSAGLNLSGGSEHTRFLVGANYYRESTVVPGDFNDQKKSVLFNLDHKAFDNKLDLRVSMNFLKQENNLFKTDITPYAISLSPNVPELLNDEGDAVLWPSGVYNNPYSFLLQPYRFSSTNFLSNATLKYALTRELEISGSFGFTRMNVDERQHVPVASINTAFDPFASGAATRASSAVETLIAEPQLKWQKSFGVHKLSVLTGMAFQESLRAGQTVIGSGFASDALLGNMSAASHILVLQDAGGKYRYSSGFGRLSYSAHEKYVLNLTGRTDASSRFGPGKRLANFGALGAAWIVSKEKFLASASPALSFAKVRGSYGTTGNDQIGDYGYLDKWAPDYVLYLGRAGLQPQNLKNDQFRWENNTKLELALETGFLEDRIMATIAWYSNRSSNQLVGYSLPGTTGFTFIQDNFPATVRNTGWEFDLTAAVINGKDWSWTTNFSFSIPQNKLLAFPDIKSSVYANTYEVGKSLFIQKRYHVQGIDPQTGMYTFDDVDKDGVISYPNDLQALKPITQKYHGAFGTQLKFKSIALDLFFQFVNQTGSNYLRGFGAPGMFGNQPAIVLHHWQQPGDIRNVGKYTQTYGSPAYQAYSRATVTGDEYISDASFVRLKNIHLSYALPASLLKRLGMAAGSFFLKGQNLLTFTNYLGMDPENQNINRLPPLKVLAVGVQAQL